MPETVMVRSPSGGLHYWFSWPEDGNVFNSAGKLGTAIDVRGDGGYVKAPPSQKADGTAYRFVEGHSPDEVSVAPAPDWLLDVVRKASNKSNRPKVPVVGADDKLGPMVRASMARKAQPRFNALLEQLRTPEEGTRNDTLSKLAYTAGDHRLASATRLMRS